MRPIEAVVAGHICLDVIPDLSAVRATGGTIYRPGGLTVIGAPHFAGGGAVHNTGIALHRLGVPTALAAKVGDDLFGRELARILAAAGAGLADGLRVVPGETTSYSVVISPPDVDRAFLHCPGANHNFGIDDINFDTIAAAKIMHLGYPPSMRKLCADDAAEMVQIFRRSKELGATTSLDMCAVDPNSPAGKLDWRAILRKTLPHVDLFAPSLDELSFMLRIPPPTDRTGLRAVGDELIAMGCAVAAIKLGEEGLFLRTTPDAARFNSAGRAMTGLKPDQWLDQDLVAPCFSANFVSATGAGDCTIAGFIAAILRNESADDAITAATAVGAASVEAPDATGGVRPWSVIQDRLKEGWPRKESRFA